MQNIAKLNRPPHKLNPEFSGKSIKLYGIIAQHKTDPSKVYGMCLIYRVPFRGGLPQKLKGTDQRHVTIVFSPNYLRTWCPYVFLRRSIYGDSNAKGFDYNQYAWNFLRRICFALKHGGRVPVKQRFISKPPYKDFHGTCYYANTMDPCYGLSETNFKMSCPKIGHLNAEKTAIEIDMPMNAKEYDFIPVNLMSASSPFIVPAELHKMYVEYAMGKPMKRFSGCTQVERKKNFKWGGCS